MNDILPPKKRPLSMDVRQPKRSTPVQPVQSPSPTPLPPESTTALLDQSSQPILIEKPKRSIKKVILWSISVLVVLLLTLAAIAVIWYISALRPLSVQSGDKVRVKIEDGSSPAQIGQLLEEKKVIRSSFAFDLYTRIAGKRMQLQAGSYSLSPAESTEQIVSHIVAGKVDQFSITFLPGATLAENRAGLIKAGYSESEVDAALNKTYTHVLFQDKPASTDLGGYIYGETYSFTGDATVEQILTRTFDEFNAKIVENHFVDDFKKQGLNLYQGITLASIIQREVPTATDQKQVAQVFLSRLKIGMPLGSDVTYQYAAKKLGVAPSPSLDSPYNTRKYPGLPPGPIASPGLTALKAVAAPASGDYLYFLSGDDNITYFARTDAEHEKNIQDHCQTKCLIP